MEQVIINGAILSANYALIALGLTLIFSIMNVLNFAHGQMYVLGGFVTYMFVNGAPAWLTGLVSGGGNEGPAETTQLSIRIEEHLG